MLIKYVGRPSPWKGKTLYDISCNLKNRGVGRVVYRWSFAQRYPEKSFYRLTRVEPDPTDTTCMRGTAWGMRVFRGQGTEKEVRIDVGNRADWRLIPKDEEAAFCRVTAVHESATAPREIVLPPLLAALYKQHLESKGEIVDEPLTLSVPGGVLRTGQSVPISNS